MRSLIAATLTLLLAVTVSLAQEIDDPYEVLDRYVKAEGGLERRLAEETSYFEGTISMGGLEGTIESWYQKPGRHRTDLVLGPMTYTQADNGDYLWVIDQNGKLQKTTAPDKATLARRKVAVLLDDYAFVDRNSGVFSVSLEGIDTANGEKCYVIKITNNINVDSYTAFINCRTFTKEKASLIEDDQSRDVFYSDYRTVDGLLVPYYTKEVSHFTGQDQETVLSKYVSNPEVDPNLFEPPKAGEKDYEFVDGDRSENIPFKFIGNHLYIPVNVNGKERLWVLDTGAGMTVITKSFALELGLNLEGELKGQGAGGTVEASLAKLPPYSVQGIRFKAQLTAVIDMDELIRRLGIDIVGVLGYDFLSRFVTKVDYANERVSFYDPETFAYSGDGRTIDMHVANGLFAVEAVLDSIHSGIWLFDIGAGSTHLHGAYAVREGYADRNGVLGMSHGAGNEYLMKKTRCRSLDFAGFTLADPIITFAYGGRDTTFTSDQIGVLGNSLFCNFVIYCDYAGERLIVEKGQKFDYDWPIDNSGLQVIWSYNRDIEVSYIAPGTPAEKAGFVKGDLIRSINGVGAQFFDGLLAVREMLKAPPGTTYDFVVDRGGREEKLNLTLSSLL